MEITRTSMLSNVTRTLDLPVTPQQVENYYVHGLLIQDAFPNLSSDQREFIKTGITKEEWDEAFGFEDDEE